MGECRKVCFWAAFYPAPAWLDVTSSQSFADFGGISRSRAGGVLAPAADMLPVADRPATPLEIAIGQTLAGVRHPVAAWRTRAPFRRLVYLSACFTASYVLMLLVLQLLFA